MLLARQVVNQLPLVIYHLTPAVTVAYMIEAIHSLTGAPVAAVIASSHHNALLIEILGQIGVAGTVF